MHKSELKRELGLPTAVLVVIASMIGAGIFGNTGLIQKEVGNPLMVMGLWFLGGLIALSGALCYAELASMMPHAGGEYVYLKNSFGLLPSFLTGWVSFIVGFSAPAASSALLASDYTHEVLKQALPGSPITELFGNKWSHKAFAAVLVIFFGMFHMTGVKKGGAMQNALTVVKIFFVILFTTIGFAMILGGRGISPAETFSVTETRWSGLGVGLLFVMFAYSGWNGATYLAEEIRDPEKNLPKALFRGTLFTMILYLGINIVYYLSVPLENLSGKEAVAAIAAENLFGKSASILFNMSFVVMLFSSLSVSLMIGPRVYYAMARDHLFFNAAGSVHGRYGTPSVSIAFQIILSLLYIATGEYDTILAYMGFALSLFPILTVLGLFTLRKSFPVKKNDHIYRTPLFPLLPLFFTIFSGLIMITAYIGRPKESQIAMIVVLLGVPVYYIWIRLTRQRSEKGISG
jgi:APA family basic amino acid/polyamine antiporter